MRNIEKEWQMIKAVMGISEKLDKLIQKIKKQGVRVPLKPGQMPPEGRKIFIGPRGGRFYRRPEGRRGTRRDKPGVGMPEVEWTHGKPEGIK